MKKTNVVQLAEFTEVLNKLKTEKAPDYDGIKPELLIYTYYLIL